MNADKASTGSSSTLTRSFLTIALVEGALLGTAVILLALDVIPFSVFLVVIAVCVAGTGIAFLRVIRGAQRTASSDAGSDAGTGANSASPDSTIDRSNPFTR
ncbi:hypothetical protein UQW22_05930 [Isoptericola halotolerans]|uniref:hypothetical protein n=1 Tax=Isoptericola halotolerans TaxID=300560 RepID=UPI0038906FE9